MKNKKGGMNCTLGQLFQPYFTQTCTRLPDVGEVRNISRIMQKLYMDIVGALRIGEGSTKLQCTVYSDTFLSEPALPTSFRI